MKVETIDRILRAVEWILAIPIVILSLILVAGGLLVLTEGAFQTEPPDRYPGMAVVIVPTATATIPPTDVPAATVSPPTITPYTPPPLPTSTGAPPVFMLQEGAMPTWTPQPPPPPIVSGQFGDGQYVVGSDIQPGMYRAPGGDRCYWARLSGFSGGIDDIIANGIPNGAAIIEIASTDRGFETRGCGGWARQ